MDLIIFLVLIAIIVFFFRDFKHTAYFFGIVEIFFRLLHFLADHIKITEFSRFIYKNIPNSLFTMLGKYANGLLYEILMWLLFGYFVALLVYLIRYFFKR